MITRERGVSRALNGGLTEKLRLINPPLRILRASDISGKLCSFPEKSLNVSIDDAGIEKLQETGATWRRGRRGRGSLGGASFTETSQDHGYVCD